jgi:lipoprotein LprA
VITADGKVPNLKVTRLEADVAAKPSVAATGSTTIQMGQQTQDAKLIFVDGHLYSDIAEPGKFVDYGPGTSIYNLSVLLDPQQGLANALAKLKDPKAAGSEDINGTKTIQNHRHRVDQRHRRARRRAKGAREREHGADDRVDL